jgi:hypothetical protein
MGLSLHEFRDDFAWFKLPNGSEFEIFAATDPEHSHFIASLAVARESHARQDEDPGASSARTRSPRVTRVASLSARAYHP